jgi:hypothetical protein
MDTMILIIIFNIINWAKIVEIDKLKLLVKNTIKVKTKDGSTIGHILNKSFVISNSVLI